MSNGVDELSVRKTEASQSSFFLEQRELLEPVFLAGSVAADSDDLARANSFKVGKASWRKGHEIF